MLPRLDFLDEEEVSFLKEVGNLYMPKYQSIIRRIKSDRPPSTPPSQPSQAISAAGSGTQQKHDTAEPPAIPTNQQTKRTPRRSSVDPEERVPHMPPIQVVIESKERRGFQVLSTPNNQTHHGKSVPATHSMDGSTVLAAPGSGSGDLEHQESALQHSGSTSTETKVQRILIKEASTNTEVDFEKDIVARELAILEKESEMLAKERALFVKESESFAKEKEQSAQIMKLQGDLSSAIARATTAESAVVEATNLLLQKEKERSLEASTTADEMRAQAQTEQQQKLEIEMAAMQESHRLEVEMWKTKESDLMRRLDATQVANKELAQQVLEKENQLRSNDTALVRSDAKVSELIATAERLATEHNSVVRRLTSDLQSYEDRFEQAEKRNTQLEQQVKEVKANLEAVYNKCIEKDEDIHRLKRTLLSKAEDMEDLKSQHSKATDRLDRMAQQQKELYDQRLETSLAQIEMEFRKEHYHSKNKLQLFQRKYQESSGETNKVREAYQLSLKREADARSEIARLQAILADDKQQVLMEDAKRADAYEVKLKDAFNEINDVKQQLEAAKERNEKLQAMETSVEELRVMNGRLRKEVKRQSGQIDTWNKLEDDLRAALKVKDVMLDDQQRQISQLQRERKELEQRWEAEIADFQCQIDDLEAALDENIQKVMDEEARREELTNALHEKERALSVKVQEIDELSNEVGKKHGALELIETEMERMRDVLNDQKDLFQKRLQKHLEQHREELERVKIATEESRELLRIQWEAERTEMMQRYESTANDLRDVAAQNAKLRVSVELERKKNAQSDQEMRVLLAQVCKRCMHAQMWYPPMTDLATVVPPLDKTD